MLVGFTADPAVQELLTNALTQPTSSGERTLVLRVMTNSKLQRPPKGWIRAIAVATAAADATQLPNVVAAARRFPLAAAMDVKLSQALFGIAGSDKDPLEARVDALAIVVGKHPQLTDRQFALLVRGLSAENTVAVRSAAADAISKSRLTADQLEQLCTVIKTIGPLELNRLFRPFEKMTDEKLGLELVASVKGAAALPHCGSICCANR